MLQAVVKVVYDPEVDVLRMVFRNVLVAESDEDKPRVILDYDEHGNSVGLEILGSSKCVEDSRTIDYGEAR